LSDLKLAKAGLTQIEHKNQRVLTTKQLADGYETDENTITKNFSRNKDRYIEGKHFYCLEGEALRGFKDCMTNCKVVDPRTPKLYLWTEKGALLHAKSLKTDKAWKVYDILVETYFRAKEMFIRPQILSEFLHLAAELAEKIEQLKHLVSFAETLPAPEDSVLIREIIPLLISLKHDKDFKKEILCTVDDCRYNRKGQCCSDNSIPLLIEYHGCGNYEPRGPELKVLPGGGKQKKEGGLQHK